MLTFTHPRLLTNLFWVSFFRRTQKCCTIDFHRIWCFLLWWSHLLQVFLFCEETQKVCNYWEWWVNFNFGVNFSFNISYYVFWSMQYIIIWSKPNSIFSTLCTWMISLTILLYFNIEYCFLLDLWVSWFFCF